MEANRFSWTNQPTYLSLIPIKGKGERKRERGEKEHDEYRAITAGLMLAE